MWKLITLIFSNLILINHAYVFTQPEQIHLSLGANPTQMIVTWTTFNKTSTSSVEYGINDLDSRAIGTSTTFVDGGSERRQMQIHRVIIPDLTPGQTYIYHCGSSEGWSTIYSFKTIQDGTDWSPRFAVYGDLGNVNAQSLPQLQEDVAKGTYDVILHVGDMAYNLDTDNARVGDEFMRQLEPIAANVPYMTTVGNHENAYNFSNYINRFSMMNMGGTHDMNNMFYSFNVGPAHIIGISTEYYFYVEYGWAQIYRQFDWLIKDLEEANRPENRQARPWIITLGHRPMYCAARDRDDCTNYESIVRTGIPIVHAYGLEDLFYKYGVDLEIWAHEHQYERMWPVYNLTVYNGSYERPYDNPQAPVHIIAGSAGCQEGVDPFKSDPPAWSAFRSSDYGFNRMTIINKTHLHMEQVSDDKGGKIIDEMMLVRDVHRSYLTRS